MPHFDSAAWLAGLVVFAMLAASGQTAAQTASPFSYTATPDGFVFGITGVDAAEAVAAVLPGGTSASTVTTQSLVGNTVTQIDVDASVGFEQSGQNNQGIVSVNQEAGNLNNQANVRVIALVLDGQVFQNFHFDVAQVRADNTLTVAGGVRETHITDSFTGSSGIAGINQSAGSLNQESNVLLMALGGTLGADVMQVGDGTLSVVSTNNTLNQGGGGTRTDSMTNSFGGYTGIAQVAQSAGDMNTISNRIVIGVTTEMFR